MFKVAIALPLGIGMMLLGETEVNTAFPYADLVLQGGALIVLAYAVWHAYKIEIPGMRKEIREDRDQFRKTLDTMGERYERMRTETYERHEAAQAQRRTDSASLKEALDKLDLARRTAGGERGGDGS